MVEPHPSREHPSSSDVAEADDDRLFALLHTHLSDPSRGDIDDLLGDHPQDRERLLALHADYQLAQSLVGHGVAAGRQASVLDELTRAAAPRQEYQDLGLLARGGMAEIRRVRDVRLDRTLVKKILPVAVHATPLDARLVRRLARFLGEARVMSGLQHPAILTVVDFGVDEQGRPFLVMPEVEGRTLDAVFADLRGGHGAGTAMVQVVQTLLPACEAVAYAHACGVVHRDLKPSNIMVGRFGEVRVMDWGLAKRIGEPDRRTPSDGDANPSTWTRTGDQIGTPAYMAPEQASGDRDAVGAHTDQYALGAILYEGLTGRRPFADQLTETTTLAVLAAIRHSLPTPLHRLAPNVPPELAAIVSKSIARSPSDRYPTVAAMVEDLRAFLETRVVAAYGRGPWQTLRQWVRRNRGLAIGIAGTMATVVAALVTLNLLQAANRSRLRTTNEALDAARREAVDNLAGLERNLYRQQLAAALRLYEDGDSTVAIRAALDECPRDLRGWEWRLLAAMATGGEPVAQCGSSVTALALAPDGSYFVAGGPNEVQVWDLEPRARRFVCSTPGWVQFVSLHAGAEVFAATTANGFLHVWDLPDGTPRWNAEAQTRSPVAFSIDGRRVYAALREGGLAARDAASGAILATAPSDEPIQQLAASPLGDSVAAVTAAGTRLLDARTLAERWTAPHAAGDSDFVQFEIHGQVLYVGVESEQVQHVDIRTGNVRSTQHWPRRGRRVSNRSMWRGQLLGRHSMWLAVTDVPPTLLVGHRTMQTTHATHVAPQWLLSGEVDGEVRRWAPDLPATRRVLRGSGREILRVELSPDGARVAGAGWDRSLWIWEVASGRRALCIPASPDPMRAVAWTRDGTAILGVGPDRHLTEWDARTGEVLRRFDLAVGWASPLALSPDGTRALTVDRTNQVVLVDLATQVVRRVDLHGRLCGMAWHPDGREFYANDPKALHRFDAHSLQRSASAALPGVDHVTVAPDGGTLAVAANQRVVLLDLDTFATALEIPHASFAQGGFLPEGNRLVAATRDGHIVVLDPSGGSTILRFLLDPRGFQTADLSADGRRFVAAGLSGEVMCLTVPVADALPH